MNKQIKTMVKGDTIKAVSILLTLKKIKYVILLLVFIGCNSKSKKTSTDRAATYSDITIVGAMKNVMWKGELGSRIDLDTIADRNGLYGLGPETFLRGELLINNGISYVAKVLPDSTMIVEQRFNTSAPFFVYGNVTEWDELAVPSNIKTIQDLEKYIDNHTTDFKRPFAFKLAGKVLNAGIHTQNLPEGTKVTSPEEAHQGQVNFTLINEEVEIIGFFSTEHKGVFTHHDSFLHMHLITKDESKMGHLDELQIGDMSLYLPKK